VPILRSTRVVLHDAIRAATLYIDNGIITRVGEYDDPEGRSAVDFGDLVVSPGIVDTHVHVNEPGRTEWEGFETATRAAAAGGVTTIVDMPLNSVPATVSVEALEAKRQATRGRCHVDVGFWGGVVPGNAGDLDALVDAGVRGFKCFLVPSGVDEFPNVDERNLREALPIIARRQVPLLVHAELPQYVTNLTHSPHQSYATYLASRPGAAEVEAVRLMIRLARESRAHVHIVHVACAEAASEISRAKAEGVTVTAETCPHYLMLTADDIADGATEFKCAPPIREAGHRAALWDALQEGVLDLVATDHSPAPPVLKCPGDFARAWGGIASLELSLPVVWTAGQRHAQLQPTDLARWMSEAPARLAGLDRRKGRIAVGFDGDLCIWDPGETMTVDAERLQQRHKLTPYAGRTLTGAVQATFVRGRCVFRAGSFPGHATGTLL
jgi:allantoinase